MCETEGGVIMQVMAAAAEVIVTFKAFVSLPEGHRKLGLAMDILKICIAAADTESAGAGKDQSVSVSERTKGLPLLRFSRLTPSSWIY